MDSLNTFMGATYISDPDNKIAVKDIYEKFKTWIIENFGVSEWVKFTQRQIYTYLKKLPDYSYVRYRNGYYLKGIQYKISNYQISHNDYSEKYVTLNIINPQENNNHVQIQENILNDNEITQCLSNLPMRNITSQVPSNLPNYRPQLLKTILPRAFQPVEK